MLFSHSVVSDSLQPHGLQYARLPCPSPTPGTCSNSCPLSQWCHPTISSSVFPFSCLQSSPALGSFPVSQLFKSGGQSIGASGSASVLPMNIQDWFSLGLTSLISLQSKGFSRVLSDTTVQKHQFLGTQPCLWSNSHPYSSVQLLSHVWLFVTPWTAAHQTPCPFPTPRACSNSSLSNQWCHPTISFSVVLFSSCLQSSPASGSFQMSQLFTSGGQCIGASASASILPMNIRGWFLLGLTGLISLLSKGLSRVFSSTTVGKHQFFSIQPFLWSNCHIHTWLLEKPEL